MAIFGGGLDRAINIGTLGLGDAFGVTNPGAPPPPPDIAGNAAANSAAARETARLNNPNVINQYGSTTFSEGADGRATMTQALSPEEQALYESQRSNKQTTADLAGKGLANLGDTFGTKFDISGAPAAPQDSESIRKSVVDAMMSRNDPRLKQAAEQQDSDLIAAGIRPGTEAWNRAKTEQGQNRNDMLSQAQLAGGQESSRAFDQDTASRKNYISELLQQRQVPLNEINALMTGSQQANPFSGQGYQGGASVPSTAGMMDQYNTNVYNQEQAGRNALIGGVTSLGASYLGRG